MATTVKVKFRPSTVTEHPGTIVYFVAHRREVRRITIGCIFTNIPTQVDKNFSYFQRTCAPSLNALPTTSPSTR